MNTKSYHLGHLFVEHMKKRPNALCQIDAATGESETNASVLRRSIQFARCLRRFGSQPGDVLALGGRNRIDLYIAYYAALMNGMPVVGIDPLYKFDEIKELFKLAKPKIAFCPCEHFTEAVRELELDTKVVTFTETGKHSIKQFIEDYNDGDEIIGFEPLDFDTENIFALLVATAGTSGILKLAAFKHQPIIDKILYQQGLLENNDNTKNKPALSLSSVNEIAGLYHAISMPLLNLLKIQTSASYFPSHIIEIINEYKPVYGVMGVSMLREILGHEKQCDFSCFDELKVTDGKLDKEILNDLKIKLRSDALTGEIYGQTETLSQVFSFNASGPVGSCGNPTTRFHVKLVDPKTGKEITAPKKIGELFVKGPFFTEYYKAPQLTAAAFTEDGWYKTGDLLYRDIDNNYYFFERKESLIKYRNYEIIPSKLEAIVRKHPAVLDVGVTGVPNAIDGERPVAIVVKRFRANVTAVDIKELFPDTFSRTKHLRGGVFFIDQLPMTSTGKIARAKLKHIAVVACKNKYI